MKKGNHLSRLLLMYREKKGYRTASKFFQSLKIPPFDYRSYKSIENGKTIPKPSNFLSLAKLIDLNFEDLLLEYLKDLFDNDEKVNFTLESVFKGKNLEEICNTLLKVRKIDEADYILTKKEVDAFDDDVRLRAFLRATFGKNLKIDIKSLSKCMEVSIGDCYLLARKLEGLGLISVDGDVITKIYKGTIIPKNKATFSLRKKLLLETINRKINPKSTLVNSSHRLTAGQMERVQREMNLLEVHCLAWDRENVDSNAKTVNLSMILSENKD